MMTTKVIDMSNFVDSCHLDDKSLCEVAIHDEEGNARPELKFLDRFLSEFCLTISVKVVGFMLVNVLKYLVYGTRSL